ncbi:MAG: translation initiation factor IF-2 [Spirochaetales bacterium]|nr:translation initiation factor IF-2 [Spirochaetales bacterium]
MGEDIKPEAQLIKHAAQKTESDAASSDKKKVVVQSKKKRKVKVVKTVEGPSEKKDVSKEKEEAVASSKTKEEKSSEKSENKIPPSIRENYLANRSRTDSASKPSTYDSPKRFAGDKGSAPPRRRNSENTQEESAAGDQSRTPDAEYPRKAYPRKDGNPSRSTYVRRDGDNNRQPYPKREGDGTRPSYPRREGDASRPSYPRREGDGTRPAYPRREGDGTRPAYPRREGDATRPAYPRREGDGTRPAYPRREGDGTRPPYPRRDGDSSRPSNYRGPGGPRTGTNPRFQNNRNAAGGGRPFSPNGRPGGGRPGMAPPTAAPLPDDGKKRVFKAKKKPEQDKKVKNREINFQLPTRKQKNTTNPVPKSIDIMEVITVSDLARKMNLKVSDLISKLMGMGMMVTINQQIDADTAAILASEFGCDVKVVSLYDETLIQGDDASEETFVKKAPVVTVMGHVDHGKTKLLDAIRTTDVVAGEHGGITQHIGAYKVKVHDDHEIVFLDTPGHAAFTLMRARGAQITDIVVLVVAANDGVMPQTKEAIAHAKEAGVPIIVAVNKIDLPEANPDRVKQQLSEFGLMPEDWGGETLFCPVSALRKEGIQDLLDSIILQAEMLELKASADMRAEGKVIEARVDHGRGTVASVLIEKGTINVGDPFVAGIYSGKVRALFDDRGNKIKSAGPSTPVEILGFSGVPSAGAPFQVTESEKEAKNVSEKRIELEKHGEAKNLKKVTLDNFYDSIQDGEIKELKVIVKGDVVGSVEAIKSALEKLSTNEIRLNVIQAGVGAIVDNDVTLADASNAIIIGFHVRPTPKAQSLADENKVDIRKYHIIYDIVDDMTAAMEGLLDPDYNDVAIGTVEVRDTFKVPKIGIIAGCYVTKGSVKRNAKVHLVRDSIEIFTGTIESLKRFKDDAREVKEGFECGISLKDCQDIQKGDIMEIFEVKEVKKTLKQSEVRI